jgi:hypothetical protein
VWDIDLAVKEVEWCAEHGLRVVNLPAPRRDFPAYTNRSRGWRISARQTWIRWRWGDETRYDVDRRLLQRADDVRPAEQHGN